ncbi:MULTISPECIES: MlaD family protein [unclassified Sphingomonas]|uniref:MlaD family protein n=1 Tax=unclassified Sphingomonas TaxID=196159 RepID=UPI0006F7D983|nr:MULTISPECIES: MlaD family protein [unclassified Sphingomonas]KQX25685.1 mammalian cell entry protein [Sphingomonas sp. Root1294]KQY66674.1 mammalian cell entry protein [Sphingomonas sp. Root50]KRB90341.1 mammalian cell entry protein [Sphingomonas sp. Root720]
METRSNHVLVGGVVLAMLVALLVFIVWLAGFNTASNQRYDIFFKTSVDGLAKGSSVNFSGVPVGKVEEIKLLPDSPEFVRVRIAIDQDSPILQGTTATIAGVGFTGVSQINLDGAVTGAPPIVEPGPYGVPVIPTKPGALGELLNSAPELLNRISTLTARLTELLDDKNQKSISGILANVERLSGDLANRGPEIAAAIVQLKATMEQAGLAAERVGALAETTNGVMASDVKPAMANLNKATTSAQHTLESLDAAITDARPGIKAFSTQTVPQINQLARNLAEMSEALGAISTKLDRGGAGAVLGGSKLPDYKPRN